jgi:hypothetical protein
MMPDGDDRDDDSWEAEFKADLMAELTDEEREWLKTPEGAAILIGRKLARDEVSLRESLRKFEESPARVGEERIHEAVAAEVRRRLARYDAWRSRLEEN